MGFDVCHMVGMNGGKKFKCSRENGGMELVEKV